MVGKKILGYTIEKQIGAGAFGTVYKVVKTNASGTYVKALKHITIPNQNEYADILNSMGGDYAKADSYFAGVLKDVVNEIQIISMLSEKGAQNIVRYYENDIEESSSPKIYDIYILMEYLKSFSDYIHTNELSVRDVIKLGKDILKALICCHKLNIIHRDIKEDNIFVAPDGTYKLGDFGISKVLTKRSFAESRKGTPSYIAPEVFLGKEKYDATVDIYSLGMMLYKLLNKSRYPFMPEYPATYSNSDEDTAFRKRMEGEKAGLPYDAKNILGETVLKAIVKRSERYNSAEEFYDALENAEGTISEKDLSKRVNQIIGDIGSAVQKQPSVSDSGVTVKMFSQEGSTEKTDKIAPEKSDRGSFDGTVPEQEGQQGQFQSSGKGQEEMAATEEMSVKGPPIISHIQGKQEKKTDFSYLVYIMPVVIAAVYIGIYVFYLPHLYGNTIKTVQWLFGKPEEIVEFLQNGGKGELPIYKIIGIKAGMYLLYVGFIASLFCLGRALQNKRQDYNPDALMRGKEPYLKAMELNELIGKAPDHHGNLPEVKKMIRNVMERLCNESDFGYGEYSVITCENEIANCLSTIEKNISALYDDKTAGETANTIVSICKGIQSKLNMRMEMKKK